MLPRTSNQVVKWFGILALAAILVMSGFLIAGVYNPPRPDCSGIIQDALEDFLNNNPPTSTPGPRPTRPPTGGNTPAPGPPTNGNGNVCNQTLELIIDGFEGVENISDTLDQFLVYGQSTCNARLGIYNVESFFPLIRPNYTAIVRFDNVREPRDFTDVNRTNVTFFPAVPNPRPDGSGQGVVLPVLVGNVLNHTLFKKFNSVPFSIGFFLNVSFFDVSPTDERLTVFLRNVEDRGPNNLEHRRYESALTSFKVVGRYQNRIKEFVRNFHDSIVINKAPVLSAFKDRLISFFLDIHLGEADHPPFVIDYFSDFLVFIAVIDANEQAAIRVMKGHMNARCVREYFRVRIKDFVRVQPITDTFTWNWLQAGMPLEAVVIESVHNIVAFSQYNNVVQLLVNQSIFPSATPGLLGRTFLRVFRDATAGSGYITNLAVPEGTQPIMANFTGVPEEMQINVVREFMRLTLPNNLWFSDNSDNNCTGCSNKTQTRHIPLLIQLRAEYDRANLALANISWSPQFSRGWNISQGLYASFNPTRYGAFPARFSAVTFTGDKTARPFDFNDTAPGLSCIVAGFHVPSSIDNETQIPDGDDVFIPVFRQPIYTAFGLGARRCPAEIFNQFVILELFKALSCYNFYDDCRASPARPNSNPSRCIVNNTNFRYELIPLAPFKGAPDSLFVLNTTNPICQYPARCA